MDIRQPLNHPFLRAPYRTLASLSLPVLISLMAEPLTGLADTAFVSRLGTSPLAALGVGAMALSAVFWIFNFLGIGTQTEVAQAHGRRDRSRTARFSGLALVMALVFGLALTAVGLGLAAPVARWMGASGEVHGQALTYIRIRLTGAPAVLVTIAAFGALRGLQDMRTPLLVAAGVNALNIALDAALIFGAGPVPALGIAGAAAASAASQWLGAVGAALAVLHRLGPPDRLPLGDVKKLLGMGGELFLRTGLLTLFLVLATRAATRIGPEAGAAHQAVRQFWVFANLALDAFALTAQSLVGYFVGAAQLQAARRVAAVACTWSAAVGLLLALVMALGVDLAVAAFVPPASVAIFIPAWRVAALAQPISALSFATDGIHWGTGDFRYLRNAVLLATTCGCIGLFLIDQRRPDALTWIWVTVALWIVIRALMGMLRIWPGIGRAPLAPGKP
jgi:MATE family multidrug resistance protein